MRGQLLHDLTGAVGFGGAVAFHAIAAVIVNAEADCILLGREPNVHVVVVFLAVSEQCPDKNDQACHLHDFFNVRDDAVDGIPCAV